MLPEIENVTISRLWIAYGKLARGLRAWPALFSSSARIVWAAFITMSGEAFAIFYSGGYFLGPMTLFVIAAWAVFFGLAAFNYRDVAVKALSPEAIVSISIMAALWLWTGASLTWSIASELTWTEFNRTGGYLALFLIAVIVGRSPAARSLAAWLFFVAASAAGIFALGAKALPTVVDNLDNIGRLAIPLEYPNALGLLMALAFPLSIYFAASRTSFWMMRLFSALVSPLLLITLYFTLSRGSVLALAIGLAIFFAAAPLRLRSFGLLMLSLPPVFLISWWSNGQPVLTQNGVELGLRSAAAYSLRLYLLYTVMTIGVVFLIALIVGKKIQFPIILTRIAGTMIILVIVASASAGIFLSVKSLPSLKIWLNETRETLTSERTGEEGPARLFTISSLGRWELWKEAIANWQDNPVAGSGGQTFPVVHLLRRENTDFVKQPHGLPFRMLSELGAVGFILIGLFIVFTQAVALLRSSKITNRWEKGQVITIVAVMTIYLIHTAYDWDWNMFALTAAYFFFAGMAIGWRPQSRTNPSRKGRSGTGNDQKV